mgnify:CR=1 FL=1
MNRQPSELERFLAIKFRQATPLVSSNGVMGIARRYYFDGGNLVIVFDRVIVEGRLVTDHRITFLLPSIRSDGDTLEIVAGDSTVSITNLIGPKFTALTEIGSLERRQAKQ